MANLHHSIAKEIEVTEQNLFSLIVEKMKQSKLYTVALCSFMPDNYLAQYFYERIKPARITVNGVYKE